MSGKAQMQLITQAKEAGLAANLLYFSARTPEICLERIARRVAEGGHDVPEDIVRRRFARSLANLPAYLALSDLWRVYEASGPVPMLALEGRRTSLTYRDEDQLGCRTSSPRDRRRMRTAARRPRRRRYRLIALSANMAPCGSWHWTMNEPPGTSIGPLVILPPADLTRSAAASIASTLK